MKLWQVIQWGNIKDGGNGPDTQLIVSAVDIEAAVAEAKIRFEYHHSYDHKKLWKEYADAVYLLGQDDRPDGNPIVIVPIWVANAFNMAYNASWHCDYESKEW